MQKQDDAGKNDANNNNPVQPRDHDRAAKIAAIKKAHKAIAAMRAFLKQYNSVEGAPWN